MSEITREGNSPTQRQFSHVKLRRDPVESAWVMGLEDLGLN